MKKLQSKQSRKAKICIIGYRNYPTCTRAIRAAEALIEAGYEVHFIGTSAGSIISARETETILHTLVTPKRLQSNIFRYIPLYVMLAIEMTFRLSILYLRERFKVIIVYSIPDFLVLTTLLPKIMGSGVVLEMLDLGPETMMTKFGYQPDHPFVRFMMFVESISIKLSDLLIVPNHPFPRSIIELGAPASKIKVIMNLPDKKVFRPLKVHADQSKFTLVFTGTIAERLDLKSLLKAINLVRDDIPGIMLRIIGSGEYSDKLEHLINELNLNNHVQFRRGIIRADRLPELVAAADVGIATYTRSIATENIMPTKVMEYIAMEKPVIVARLYTISWYFNDRMVLFYEPGDFNDLARCIRELFQSPEKRKKMVEEAKKFEKKYNWDTQKDNYAKYIQSLMN